MPHDSVPVGKSAADNVEVRRHGTPREFAFTPQAHWDLGPALGIIDFERGTKIAGARFSVLVGAGARLARALINFMLDLHTTEHGYTEVEPPFMANTASLTGTGNLPKFEADLFKIAGDWDLYLVPTAEVPLTNMHRGEILDGRAAADPLHGLHAVLPQRGGLLRRRRARPDPAAPVRQGRADGRSRTPEQSYDELERLTGNAEEVLKRLELPYRTMLLCTGDMGFASAKTYDIEVWLPARTPIARFRPAATPRRSRRARANIKFRPAGDGQGGVRPHAERLGPRGRPHADRDPRELPAGRRLGRDPGGAAPVHGRASRSSGDNSVGHDPVRATARCGEMAEWFKAAVLKTVEPERVSGGSNPSPSANLRS